MEDYDLELDNSWVDKVLEEDKEYDDFYSEKNNSIAIYKIYVNCTNSIIAINKDIQFIDNGILSKFDLSLLLKNNVKYNNMKFAPISLLKYNVDVEPENVSNFIKNNEKYNFLTVEKHIQDLKWNDSITLFKDMNSLYIIFYEKNKKKEEKKNTKSIFFKKYKKNKTRKSKRI